MSYNIELELQKFPKTIALKDGAGRTRRGICQRGRMNKLRIANFK